MSTNDASWYDALRVRGGPGYDHAVIDLSDYLRRALARAFGHQLSEADLSDMTQDSLVKILDKLETFRGQSRFSTWATAIAVNRTLGELRRRKHAAVSLDDAVKQGSLAIAQATSHDAGASASLERDELATHLEEAIETALTDLQKTALRARLSGMPVPEIAARLAMTPGALYKLLHDARKRLRRHLEALGWGSQE